MFQKQLGLFLTHENLLVRLYEKIAPIVIENSSKILTTQGTKAICQPALKIIAIYYNNNLIIYYTFNSNVGKRWILEIPIIFKNSSKIILQGT